MVENGPLATTVRDAALVLSVMADDPALADVAEPERPLRIAVSLRPPVTGVRADLEHLRAVVRTARLLEPAGHVVSRVDPPYAANPVPELARWFGGASYDAEGLDRSLLDPAVRAHVRVGDQVRRRGLVKDADREARQEAMAEFFAAYDLLLTPGAGPAARSRPRAGGPGRGRGWSRRTCATRRTPRRGTCCSTRRHRSPPASIPPSGRRWRCRWSGRRGTESRILGLSAQVERLAPWRRRAPGY